ncbi:MAG: hypothetical protein WD048_09530 [Chitinophagales bacterium]
MTKRLNNSNIIVANNYYTGGMLMPGRVFYANSPYRFGYQGSERDDEIAKGLYTTHFRQMDTRLLRWWSIDPKTASMPWQSPYMTMDGNPIVLDDKDGDCATCISGAIAGAITEIVAQFAVAFFVEGNDAETALKNIVWEDVVISTATGAVSGAFDGGMSKWASFFAKSRNRKALEIMIKEGGDILIEGINNTLQAALKDDEIDVKDVVQQTLVSYGIGKAYSSKVKNADLGSGNKKVEIANAKDRASRKSASQETKNEFTEKGKKASNEFIQLNAAERVIDGAVPASAGKIVNEESKNEE